MHESTTKIGIVAPASRIDGSVAELVSAVAQELYGDRVELFFHSQCFLSSGHFAGGDAVRADAFVEVANDNAYDALWWARGGYGANRIAEPVLPRLNAKRARLGTVGMILTELFHFLPKPISFSRNFGNCSRTFRRTRAAMSSAPGCS